MWMAGRLSTCGPDARIRRLPHVNYGISSTFCTFRFSSSDKFPLTKQRRFRERAKDLMPPGQESLMIIVDYKSTTLRTNPSISVARKVLTILQHHYVETLGRAIVVNLPAILSFFYKGISPFLDPVTRDKMRFNPDLFELVPREQLDADFGGNYPYEFEPESYWIQLIKYVIVLVLVAIFPFRFYHLPKTDGGTHAVLFIPTGHVASRLTAHA